MKKIAVIDLETDPFSGSEVFPFCAGYYDGSVKACFWGIDCAEKLAKHILKQPGELIIYAHNGGRFDFYYLLPWIERREISIVDSRIIRCWAGKHQLRDSYAILPFPLGDFAKKEIDYNLFHRDNREHHRAEILEYLSWDLQYLYDLVSRFVSEFGDYLTIGSVALRELQKQCPFWRGGETYDQEFRDRWFIGGRCEMVSSGVINDTVNLYDVNQMYGSVMRDVRHPVGTTVSVGTKLTPETVFLTVEGNNFGAFAVRRDSGELDFNTTNGTYHVTRHEFDAAEESGTFQCNRIVESYSWKRTATFAPFVDTYYGKRLAAAARKDRAGELLYKHVLNAASGKFAQNPSRYSDYYLTRYGQRPPDATWEPRNPWAYAYVSYAQQVYALWKRRAHRHVWYNVATAASITGAARAKLLRAISVTERPLYFDTDSILCRGTSPVARGNRELGAWKLEATGDRVALVSKKVYAVWNKGSCVHKASAGCILEPEEILKAAQGEVIEKTDQAPTFSLTGAVRFRKHTIRKGVC